MTADQSSTAVRSFSRAGCSRIFLAAKTVIGTEHPAPRLSGREKFVSELLTRLGFFGGAAQPHARSHARFCSSFPMKSAKTPASATPSIVCLSVTRLSPTRGADFSPIGPCKAMSGLARNHAAVWMLPVVALILLIRPHACRAAEIDFWHGIGHENPFPEGAVNMAVAEPLPPPPSVPQPGVLVHSEHTLYYHNLHRTLQAAPFYPASCAEIVAHHTCRSQSPTVS